MPQQRRSTIILTPDYFGNFSVDFPLDSLYYEGQLIEADALVTNNGALLCYQPKGDITGLPDFLYPHEISYNPKTPPAPPASSKIRASINKEGAPV